MKSTEATDESSWVEVSFPGVENSGFDSGPKIYDGDRLESVGMEPKSQQKALTPDQVESYRQMIDNDVSATVAQNALSRNSVWKLTRSRRVIQTNFSSTFSINLDHGDMSVSLSARCTRKVSPFAEMSN